VLGPDNLQNFNGYSYLLHNPLNTTDPSGYFLKSLLKKIASIPWLNSVISIALNFIPGCQVWCPALWNAATTYAQTGSLGAALQAGLTSIAIQGFLQGIGDYFSGVGGINQVAVDSGIWAKDAFIEFGGNLLTGGQVATQISAPAFMGGMASLASDGKFGHGFLSAGITKGQRKVLIYLDDGNITS